MTDDQKKLDAIKEMLADMTAEGMLIIPATNNAKAWFSMRMNELTTKLNE